MIIEEDTHDIVHCQICGKGMKTLGPHFKSHKLTVKQYQEMFPNAKTQCEAERLRTCERAKKSNAQFKGKKRDPEIGRKASQTRKENPKPNYWLGRKHSEESKQKQSKTMSEKYTSGEITHWNTGKTHSEETKQKIRESTRGYKLTDEQRQNWEDAMIKIRTSSNYIAPMEGKKHSAETRVKLSKSAKRHAKTMQKEAQERVEQHLWQFNISVVQKVRKGYYLKCQKCNTNFFRTNGVLFPSRYKSINGEYCPCCYPSKAGLTWSLAVFEENEEIKQIYGELYIVRFFNDVEDFIKVGITSISTKERWGNFKKYNIEIIKVFKSTIYKSFCIEQKVLLKFKDQKYLPKISFGGQSECLEKEILQEVINLIKMEFQQNKKHSAEIPNIITF